MGQGEGIGLSFVLVLVVLAVAIGAFWLFWAWKRSRALTDLKRVADGQIRQIWGSAAVGRFDNIAFSEAAPTAWGWSHGLGTLVLERGKLYVFSATANQVFVGNINAALYTHHYSHFALARIFISDSESGAPARQLIVGVRGFPKTKLSATQAEIEYETKVLVDAINRTCGMP